MADRSDGCRLSIQSLEFKYGAMQYVLLYYSHWIQPFKPYVVLRRTEGYETTTWTDVSAWLVHPVIRTVDRVGRERSSIISDTTELENYRLLERR